MASGVGFSGTYNIVQTRETLSCSPQALPEPVRADPLLYADMPRQKTGSQYSVRVEQDGSSLSRSPLDMYGAPVASLRFNGSIGQAGLVSVIRTEDVLKESLREGGHNFVVEGRFRGTIQYVTQFAHIGPSATAELSSGTDSLIFHEGILAGQVFTTCAVEVKGNGYRND